MEQAKLPIVDGFKLEAKCDKSVLYIEAEELTSGRRFSIKLDNDTLKQITNELFVDAKSMLQGLQDAINRVHNELYLTISTEGKITYYANKSLGPIKKEHGFSFFLEEKPSNSNAVLAKTVNSLTKELEIIKAGNELKNKEFMKYQDKLVGSLNELRTGLDSVKEEKIPELEIKLDSLIGEFERIKLINEEKNTELSQNLIRIEERLFERLDKLEKRLDSMQSPTKEKTQFTPNDIHFNPLSRNSDYYYFSDNNKTVKANSKASYPCLECLPPIPSSGEHEYSILIKERGTGGIGIGISEVIDKMNWNTSAYRFWTDDGLIYVPAGLGSAIGSPLARFLKIFGQKNDIISLLVDMDNRRLTIKMNNEIVNSCMVEPGKYYLFISLSNTEDCLTLL